MFYLKRFNSYIIYTLVTLARLHFFLFSYSAFHTLIHSHSFSLARTLVLFVRMWIARLIYFISLVIINTLQIQEFIKYHAVSGINKIKYTTLSLTQLYSLLLIRNCLGILVCLYFYYIFISINKIRSNNESWEKIHSLQTNAIARRRKGS